MVKYKTKSLCLGIFLIVVFFLSPKLNFAQLKSGENYYLNQDNDNIIVTIKDTILNSNKNDYIKYDMYNISKKRILKSGIIDKKTLRIVNAYFISNDLSSEFYITTEHDTTFIKVISGKDTTVYKKLFKENTNPFSFIDLVLEFSDVFVKDEITFNSYIFYPQPLFKFIAVNEGIEKIKVKGYIYDCYHIKVNAKGFLASSIMPDLDIWYAKNSKIVVKRQISDSYIIINNNFK